MFRPSHEIIRMQFSGRPLKIGTTFLGHGSVTENNIYHLSVYWKMQSRYALLGCFRSRTAFRTGWRSKRLEWERLSKRGKNKLHFCDARSVRRASSIFVILTKVKPKIKYAVNVLGRTNQWWRMFLHEENMQHNESTISPLVVKYIFSCKQKFGRMQGRFQLGKKLVSSALDSSKATIVSKALYDSEGSYGVIPKHFPRFSTFFLFLLTRISTWTQTDRASVIFSYVLLRCRVAIYLSVSVRDKVFFFGSKHRGTNKR